MGESTQAPATSTSSPVTAGKTGADHLHDSLAGAQLPADPLAGGAGGSPGGRSMGELSVYLLEKLEQGDEEPLRGLSAESRAAGEQVWGIVQKNRALVDRCIKEGIDRVQGGGVERVKPAPAHAIAGFLGLAPKDPTWRKPA